MASKIISCDCGTKVRVPENRTNRTFRCPQCKTGLALTVDARVLSLTPVDANHQTACPICQSEILSEEQCVTCPGCDQVHHRECWSEIGGCGTYGCEQAPAVEKTEDSHQTLLSAWGDTKRCPACGEEIKAIALKCRYCEEEFDSVDPMTTRDLRKQAKTKTDVEKTQQSIVTLFVVSLLGCTAPLVFPIGLIYVLPRRKIVAKCNPLYAIMAWVSIFLSGFFCLLIFFFMVLEAS